ncbi:c-type cytochrome [Xylophilus sp. Leaf220]|uniref:c-type cytochrome n=1 Tax=Xylophilus sp. Leaf220 TaxID=1735686 RepID=UPI00350EA464
MAGLLVGSAGLASAQVPTAAAAVALARDRGCMTCHGIVHRQVGPGFAQIAERYRQDPTALARLAVRIRTGSVGQWGRLVMPRQAQVGEAEARVLAEWVLGQPAR